MGSLLGAREAKRDLWKAEPDGHAEIKYRAARCTDLPHSPSPQFLLGHVSIQTTKRYLGCKQRFRNAATVKNIRSEGVYADAIKGNVIEHVAAETDGGKTVYIGTRLKLADGKITEVEINFDDRPNVNVKNLVPYDPIFNTIVPPDKRSTREQLEQIITRYFQGLTNHNPIEADYDPRCDRYHSGNRVTHNPRNGVEESGDVGCYESNLGPKPWGPATETRIALVDPERGIVIGYSVLYYGNSDRRMQINEVFKILDGRIRLIDNIGLMEEGITTSGFTN